MRYLFLVLFVFSATIVSAQNNPNTILGKWESTEKNLVVEVYGEGKIFKAKIIWFYDPDDTISPVAQRLDIKNPDKNLRTRKIVGADILSNLEYNAKQNRWTGGRIYDASSGKTWDATVWLLNNNELSVRGFYIVRWFGKTLNFFRVN